MSSEPLDLLIVKVEATGSLILLVCRSPAGERYTVQVPFRPFLYVPKEEADAAEWSDKDVIVPGFKSAIDDRELVKVVVPTPGDVPKRRKGKTHYEAAVPYPRRFLVSLGLKKGLRLKRYEVLNEEHRTLSALPEDIEPADVDAPMFGWLYDIETNRKPDGEFGDEKQGDAPVSGITFVGCRWDSSGAHPGELFHTIQWHPSNQTPGSPVRETRVKYSHAHGRDVLWHITTFATEQEMMLDLVKRVKKARPDILAAWNGHYGFKTRRRPGGAGGYDAPFLINRLDRLRIGSNQLSPFNQAHAHYRKRNDGPGFWSCEIAGIQLVDMMTAMTIKDGGMTGNVAFANLKDVVESKTTMPILKDPDRIEDWWQYSNDAYLDYSFQDVDALAILEKKEDYVGYVKRFQWASGTEDANKLFSPSAMIASLALRQAIRDGVVLPTGGEEAEDSEVLGLDERGGYVIAPRRRGVLKDVVDHDFAALYAAIVESCNIGRDTLVIGDMPHRDDDIIIPLKDDWSVTARFRAPHVKMGVMPPVLRELRALRKVFDDKIALAKSPAEVKALKKEREPFKQLLLSAWGVQKNAYFTLSHPLVGEAIPAAGRFLIKSVDKASQEAGVPMFYADTDGSKTVVPEGRDPVEFGFWFEKNVALPAYDAAAKRMNLQTHNFEMGFEKMWQSFAMGRTKKRYAGIVAWAEGNYAETPHGPACAKKCPHFEMSGVEAVTHSAAPVTKETEIVFLKGILNEQPVGKLVRHVRSTYEAVKRGDMDVRDVVKAQRIGFDLEENKNTDIMRGAKNGHDLFGFNYKIGERVYLLRLVGTHDVVAIPREADIPKKHLKVDWEWHAEAAVLKPLRAIAEWVGAEESIDAIETGAKPTKQTRLAIG